MASTNNIFEKLNTLNVNDHVSVKNNGKTDLKYLSWAWAWESIKKLYPEANYTIERFEDNKPYLYDENLGFMVFTSVTIGELTHEMWLPVMNGANKAMKAKPYTYKTKYGDKSVEPATMMDINTTIMRCLTKNLAMFGLGLYIYAGEDLPAEDYTERINSAYAVLEKMDSKLTKSKVDEELQKRSDVELKKMGSEQFFELISAYYKQVRVEIEKAEADKEKETEKVPEA
jgi:hypothetical protein